MAEPVPFRRLLLEEVRALPRVRFALPGAAALAAVLLAMGALVATSLDGVWSFALVAYGILPSALAGVAAAQMASLRATRFGQALYTTPVRSGQVLAARLLVALGLGALYLLATLPFLALAAAHVEVDARVLRALLQGLGVLVFSAAFGTMVGVLLAGRSVAGPALLAGGFVLLSFFAMTFAMGMLHMPADADPLLLRALHASPHLLLSDALGVVAGHTGVAARRPGLALGLFAVETLACVAVAAWAYTRAQGPEGWEAPRGRRTALAALAVAALLLPVAAADAAYERVPGFSKQARGWSSEARNGSVLLVPPGAGVPEFGERHSGTLEHPLLLGRANARDLLVLVHAPHGRALLGVEVTLDPGASLEVDARRFDLGDVRDAPAGRTEPDAWGRGWSGVVLRVPVTLTPRDPLDLTANAYALRVNATYLVDGEAEPRAAQVLAALRGDVAWVRAQMALAGAPAVLLAAGAALARRVRVGGV
ncbi:MAG TPA: hypothetical protein VNX21_09410 [Candidatus Thermoplasmatota archaeon]|nr:hypothetical protein [Candidatus Thermoplasmatota archaeon]